ncbi:MAG: hypothetical protein AAF850_08905 [Pseudomonadota bacterium]
MSSALERSVQTLAEALDRLEGRLTDKLSVAAGDNEALIDAHRRAATARARLQDASDELADVMLELRTAAASDAQVKA